MAKKFHIKTLGCKVNQYEGQAIREALLRAGFQECQRNDTADIYIVNTCTVTRQADSESRQVVRQFNRKNHLADIVVTGCCVERNSDAEVFSTLPGVSHLIKNADKWRIADILNGGNKSETVASEPFIESTISDFKDRAKAFIKIQDGCDQGCSYCRVWQVRGPVKSKPVDVICREAKALVDKGFKELILTGICLGAWGKDLEKRVCLVDVLKSLETVEGSFRIRLSSIEPGYISDDLIDYIASKRSICRHLHIPLQSGDDDILRKMNRAYTVGAFLSLVEKIRSAIPDIGISTDVIVGFPGETEAHFKNTVRTTKQILPVRTHIFPFSKRRGTAAYEYLDHNDSSPNQKRHPA